MLCDVCQRQATEGCPSCRVYFCPDHGGERCFRCAGLLTPVGPEAQEVNPETAIYTTDRDSHYSGTSYLQCYTRSEMVSIYIDDPGPPECYECQGLAKILCQNCQQLVCDEHRGGASICRRCARSSLLGLWVTGIVLALFALLVFLNR